MLVSCGGGVGLYLMWGGGGGGNYLFVLNHCSDFLNIYIYLGTFGN